MSAEVVAYHCFGEEGVAVVAVLDTTPEEGEVHQSELFRTLAKWLRRNPDFYVRALNVHWSAEDGYELSAWGSGSVAEPTVTR